MQLSLSDRDKYFLVRRMASRSVSRKCYASRVPRGRVRAPDPRAVTQVLTYTAPPVIAPRGGLPLVSTAPAGTSVYTVYHPATAAFDKGFTTCIYSYPFAAIDSMIDRACYHSPPPPHMSSVFATTKTQAISGSTLRSPGCTCKRAHTTPPSLPRICQQFGTKKFVTWTKNI